ncbi:MAG: hypothetical protein IKR34_07975 [Candidatus Gastranaerophilales bacterium]|nr:hypothetical protein [Candidatus Gastranaerophilales bacterium]
MQIPRISLNKQNSILKPQKISLNKIPAKINFQGQNSDTFTSSSETFSNEDAMELIRAILQEAMGPEELDEQIKSFESMCGYLGIEPRHLPIDEKHQGSLTDDQKMQITFLTDPRNIEITKGLI